MTAIDWSQMTTAEAIAQAARDAKFAALREYRWTRETGGVTVAGLGTIPTTRESQSQISSVITSLTIGAISAPVAWSVAGGWADLTADQISGIGAAVAAHVQACFDAQRAVEAEMTALDDLTDFDHEAAFDAAYAARQ